ncbi:MAG: hypothetical protein HOO06_01735 [Bdellovibrionaceae bacterium]|nr:hypothetical protein [Pseudobdellovibrionaceae bacterium]
MENRGLDLDGLYELTNLNVEFLNDPTSWLDAHQMEDFLFQVNNNYSEFNNELMLQAGEGCPNLKSWGVLDSVLKMMDGAEALFTQPDRIISYFISPAPQIQNLSRAPSSVSFEIPISSDEFPTTVNFLKAAFGSIPKYMGKSFAKVDWDETHIIIEYSGKQIEQLKTEMSQEQSDLSSETMDSMFQSLEDKQIEIERKNKALSLKDQELERLKQDLKFLVNKKEQGQDKLGVATSFSDETLNGPMEELSLNIQKFSDYFHRSQQLITLLVGSKRLDPQVKAAMKRVKWDQVTKFSPYLLKQIFDQVEEVGEGVRNNGLYEKNQGNMERVLGVEKEIFNPAIMMQEPEESDNESFLINNKHI